MNNWKLKFLKKCIICYSIKKYEILGVNLIKDWKRLPAH